MPAQIFTIQFRIIYSHILRIPKCILPPAFNNQFQNKQIFSGEELVSILVIKGGNATGKNEVDAISGGTITSKGVENMLRNYLTYYEPFLKQK